MGKVRVLVGTRKGAFVITADGSRSSWQVEGPHFGGWEIYHVKGSPADPNRIYASQSSGWSGQVVQRSDDGGRTWDAVGNEFSYDGAAVQVTTVAASGLRRLETREERAGPPERLAPLVGLDHHRLELRHHRLFESEGEIEPLSTALRVPGSQMVVENPHRLLEGAPTVASMTPHVHELPEQIAFTHEEYWLQHAALEGALDVLGSTAGR